MKKIISFFIILSLFALTYSNVTMAYFMADAEAGSMMMSHDMMSMKMDNTDTKILSNCMDNKMQCCYLPFGEASQLSNIHASGTEKSKIKGKILNLNFLALFQETQEYNYIHRLTSPPKQQLSLSKDNFYVTLTGIIKNNC